MYIGIDPSTKCGLAAVRIDDDRPVLVKTSVASVDKLEGIARATKIGDACLSFIGSYTSPAVPLGGVCIEGYSFASKFRIVDMVEVGTVIRHRLIQQGITPIVCPPTTLKVGITGNGKAKKTEMILAAYKRWGWELPDDDRCDAVCLAVMAACYYGKYPSDAKMREAVGKISLCK